MAQQNPITGSFGAVAAADAAGVHVAGLNKSFGANHVLRGIDLDVAPGEVVCLIGPSGSGKSTLLRCVNLLEKPDSGVVTVGEFTVTDEDVDLDLLRRHVGMVFQQFNLFPHLSVLENCTVAQLKVLKRGKAEAVDIARRQLARVGLAELEDRYPDQLSGGQQQRVALARAMAPRPPLILLDEPFGALDASLRSGLRRDVRQALKEDGATAVLVTHDQSEALSMADRAAVMRAGRLRQLGTPDEVYAHPADAWVAAFVGEASLLPLLDVTGPERDGGRRIGRTALGPVPLHGARAATAVPGDLVVVRPEHVRGTLDPTVDVDGVEAARVWTPATVVDVDYRGHDSVATVQLADGTRAQARVEGALPPLDAACGVRLAGPCAVVAPGE